MIVKIDAVENKSNDWKVVSLTQIDGTKNQNVSVNRVNKKGEIFPNFDGITVGNELEADLWTSDAGKMYMFAPKIKPQGGASRGSGAITKAMETKNENIKEAQTRKEESIAKAGAQRDAVLIVTNFYADKELAGKYTDSFIKEKIEEWYKYFMNLGDQPFV